MVFSLFNLINFNLYFFLFGITPNKKRINVIMEVEIT